MIVGVGVDIVDISRIQKLFDRFGDRFLQRVFTEKESAYAMGGANTAERLAGRFAVKESVMKALGTGKIAGDPVAGRRDGARAFREARGPPARAGGEMGEDAGRRARCTCRSRMTAGRRWRS